MTIWKVYLDACVLNRLSDDQVQPRVIAEAEAIENILGMILVGRVEWSASVAVEREIRRNPNDDKRSDALAVLAVASTVASPLPEVLARAEVLRLNGYGTFDGLHVAYAEDAQVDVLLTTDDRLIRMAARGVGSPRVRVVNPLDWLEEVRDGSRRDG